jgi:hypothetical protein
MNPKGHVIATIPHSNGLYRVTATKSSTGRSYAAAASGKMTISKAHRKLGHVSCWAISHAISKGYITRIELEANSKLEFCEVCAEAKAARQPFPKESDTRATKYGERVHWDLWGPAMVKSLNGHHYVAAWIDNTTRETKLYSQEKKSQTFNSYKKDEAYIETQTSNQIKVCHSDRGGEFQSNDMMNHQDNKGTVREFTVHNSPPQNGVVERGMRTRAEWAWALLIASGLPRFLWEEAMNHSTWLQNQLPAAALEGKTPYEAWHNKKPHLAGIQEFGAAAYVKDLKAGKLDAWAKVGRFVGYDSESKGFRIYWPGKRTVTVERDIVFNENNIRDGSVMISSNVLSEGEIEGDKIIQHPANCSKDLQKSKDDDEQSEKQSLDDSQDPNTSSDIPFSSATHKTAEVDDENGQDENLQRYGRGQRQ